ncbi:MAG: RtcB family protein [Saprospiraceae bacterium]|nr:RtcB family protein [Saprospiraceae bacterium]HMW40530.1 RtcB family protein [Saprospiraceae bacterium]HMX89246.1 RtcB family protein [Saprospiraceae bacterium]HMZ41163.1 RtcB family protein [Saprospiraceae bacterium]HNA65065.1 RtcB family protein [Saprospiraceae bacterium]
MRSKSEKINGNDLIQLGYPPNDILGIALRLNEKRHGFTKQAMLDHYAAVLATPHAYTDVKPFDKLAHVLVDRARVNDAKTTYTLQPAPLFYPTFGTLQIEEGARQQMELAMRLPVTVAGALMPDAHQGYGLPIGGVLATENAVIPYGVGVDIGCRMCLSLCEVSPERLDTHRHIFRQSLMQNTLFGAGKGFDADSRSDHEVLDDPAFHQSRFIHSLLDKAWCQLGTSGGGNHFAEWGIVEVKGPSDWPGVREGSYVALLTHSGSRGLGATIANHFTQIAKSKCPLPREAQNLAFLSLDEDAGQSYWESMSLAGAYASACHEIIHQKILAHTGFEMIARVENHHNFAWKECIEDRQVIVHRKGATPADVGVLGIIPGSMTAPGFIVRGRGHRASLQSAAHGAGRQMSRTAAMRDLRRKDLETMLMDSGVELIGAGLDEAPQAYKDIHQVMAAQRELVDIIGTFYPRLVRMADDGSRED